VIDDGADAGDNAEGGNQKSEDEPRGAAAGLVVRLRNAEGAEEGAGHVFKQMHGAMVALGSRNRANPEGSCCIQ
jgi:hypothetical protein